MNKYYIKKIILIILIILSLTSCTSNNYFTSNSINYQNEINIENGYCSEKDLYDRLSVDELLEHPKEWIHQYPSGDTEKGMLYSKIEDNYKSKYLSGIRIKDDYFLRFSLNANDLGTSGSSSSVRTELANGKKWYLTNNCEMSYNFFYTSNSNETRFNVGQFLMRCDKKDSPLCRIVVIDNELVAKISNYLSDGLTLSDGIFHNYSLGHIDMYEKVSIKLSISNKLLTIARDSTTITHKYPEEISTNHCLYFKIGLYYSNLNSKDIFTEVFINQLKVDVN